MNRDNLLKMAEYIKTIPQERFNIAYYREDGIANTHECNTVGCIIGHCTILDDTKNLTFDEDGNIDFTKWSEKFTGLEEQSNVWDYLFSGQWHHGDNTPIGASKRIKYFLKNGLPSNWFNEMYGDAPLSYY